MTSLVNRKTAVIFIIIVLLGRTLAFAEGARLTNIVVTNTHDDLLLYLNVEGAFIDKMKKAVLSGVPTTFSFVIKLFQVRSFWADKEIADIRVTHKVKYDSLKKEFLVTRSWENGKLLATPSITETQKLMSEIDNLVIVPLSRLQKGRHYQIRAKAELSKLTLPFNLHYVLFFVSLWDFETDWYTIDFIY
jgi:hypothetical protein